MKLLLAALALTTSSAFAQTMSLGTNSTATTSSLAQGPGSGGVATGGTATATGGDPTAAVILNMNSPSASPQPTAAAQGGDLPTQHVESKVKTVGTPGSMSLGISFSQYNCANSAGGGVGFMGGVIQIGGGMESDPCNARANASAFFQIAQTLATSNPALAAQLYHAAILLIGNSTKSTTDALKTAGVADWSEVPGGITVVPTGPGGVAVPGITNPPLKPPAESPPSSIVPHAAVAVASSEPVYGERIVTAPIPDTTIVTPTGESTLVADPIQFTTKISQLK